MKKIEFILTMIFMFVVGSAIGTFWASASGIEAAIIPGIGVGIELVIYYIFNIIYSVDPPALAKKIKKIPLVATTLILIIGIFITTNNSGKADFPLWVIASIIVTVALMVVKVIYDAKRI